MDILDIVLYSLIAFVVILIVIGLAIANYAGKNLITIYNENASVVIDFYNTLNFANLVSNSEFNGAVKSRVIDGILTDNYYNKTISLSQNVAYANNVSAYAVCAHELGHAIQFRDNPKKMKSFSSKQLISRILSKFTLPLFLIGIVCTFFNIILAVCILGLSVLTFVVGLLAKLSTIKIEKEASQNAIMLLQKYTDCDDNMIKRAKKVLNAAKLTYIASFLKSVLAWTLLVNKYDFY